MRPAGSYWYPKQGEKYPSQPVCDTQREQAKLTKQACDKYDELFGSHIEVCPRETPGTIELRPITPPVEVVAPIEPVTISGITFTPNDIKMLLQFAKD